MTLFTPAFRRFLNAKAWDESQHPRGQPENAGQFAPSEGAREAVEKARGGGPNQSEEVGNGEGEKNPSLPSASRPELTDREIAEVRSYLSEETEYYGVNEHLRGGGELYDETLQKAINKCGIFSDPVKVYRGFEADDLDALAEELKSGTFTDRGFMSTSTFPGGAFAGNVKLTIHARHGLDASHYGFNSGEMLLPAGSDFRVIKYERTKKGIVAELEQVV